MNVKNSDIMKAELEVQRCGNLYAQKQGQIDDLSRSLSEIIETLDTLCNRVELENRKFKEWPSYCDARNLLAAHGFREAK